MGKIVAFASKDTPGQVEIIMSDGEDCAITQMTPDQALKFTIDLMSAAQAAASATES